MLIILTNSGVAILRFKVMIMIWNTKLQFNIDKNVSSYLQVKLHFIAFIWPSGGSDTPPPQPK